MKYLLEKDKKRRILFEKFEKKKILLIALSKDVRLSFLRRIMFRLELFKFNKNTSKTRVKNRCSVTGRGRGVFRAFRMSRLQIRELLVRGMLYGVRKASW